MLDGLILMTITVVRNLWSSNFDLQYQVSSCLAEGLWSPVTINCVVSASTPAIYILLFSPFIIIISKVDDFDCLCPVRSCSCGAQPGCWWLGGAAASGHHFAENAEHITPCMGIDDSVNSGLARGPGMGRKSPRRDVHHHPGYCLCAQVLWSPWSPRWSPHFIANTSYIAHI